MDFEARLSIWAASLTDWADGLSRETASLIIALAATLGGLVVGAVLVRLLQRLGPRVGPRLSGVGLRVRGPFRLFVVLVALALAAPWIADDSDTSAVARRFASVAFIGLIGWTVLATLNAYVALAEKRYRIDVEDNFLARKHLTQFQVLRRVGQIFIVLATVAAMLMTFPAVRDYGVSLFASAGAAGLIFGLAARPVLSNLIAGVQIALTQPIRLEDAVVVEGEWGWIERITATYVVLRIWDWRRLIVPLTYFIEKPFQNWTRDSATILGSVFWQLDYTAPVQEIREKLEEVAEASDLWDRRVVNLQVVDAKADTIELRALVSARNSPRAWDLRCEVREKILSWLQEEHPGALPRTRAELAPGLAPERERERDGPTAPREAAEPRTPEPAGRPAAD